jgi:hypothetical protein
LNFCTLKNHQFCEKVVTLQSKWNKATYQHLFYNKQLQNILVSMKKSYQELTMKIADSCLQTFMQTTSDPKPEVKTDGEIDDYTYEGEDWTWN